MRPLLIATVLPLLISAAPEIDRRDAAPVASATGDRICAEPPLRHAESQVRAFKGPEADVPFDLHYAVVRDIDGCIVPAIVRRDVDGRGDVRPKSDSSEPSRDPSTLLRPL